MTKKCHARPGMNSLAQHFFAASSVKKMSPFEEVSPEEIKIIA